MNNEMNYKPNSRKYKTEQGEMANKKVEKVVKGKARVKKKSEFHNFMGSFISEDAKNVKSYILGDILIPTIKKAISDIINDGISMILYGEAGHRSKSTISSKISYRNYYDRKDDRGSYDRNKTRSGYSYDDIILETRGEAEDVLSRMDELIDQYGMVSVADLYDLVGITGNYTDNKYGWTNIRSAEPVRVRDGYMLRLPKALPL